jgi:hypothetical protein
VSAAATGVSLLRIAQPAGAAHDDDGATATHATTAEAAG